MCHSLADKSLFRVEIGSIVVCIIVWYILGDEKDDDSYRKVNVMTGCTIVMLWYSPSIHRLIMKYSQEALSNSMKDLYMTLNQISCHRPHLQILGLQFDVYLKVKLSSSLSDQS